VKTQLEQARANIITEEMRTIAISEDIEPSQLCSLIAQGKVVILKNKIHGIIPSGVGVGLRTKVNANIGTSELCNNLPVEIEKLKIAQDNGADVLMDLSTGTGIDATRKEIMKHSIIPVGTVPIYQAMVEAYTKLGDMRLMNEDLLFEVIEKQCADGVDFITVHCGVTREVVRQLDDSDRLTGVVSRGGSFLAKWIRETKKENPLFEHYDRLISIAKKYDVVLSLGDGLRPGSLADATDRAQIQELIILGELTKKALDQGVSVMVEGPGHVPIDQIETNIRLQKELCYGVPFYVLGPLVTDIAPGYDHITAAIGGAWAAFFGADFLCYVTPAEHLGLPSVQDVKDGVIVSRIAAHAADVAKNRKYRSWDDKMSRARKNLDWETQLKLAVDPDTARQVRTKKNPEKHSACSMCGEFCSMK